MSKSAPPIFKRETGASNRAGMLKRILITADAVGGVWSYALEMARQLAESGVQVALATMGSPLSMQQRKTALAIKGLAVYESTYALEWMDEPWIEVDRAGKWLLDVANDFAPDVVHLNGYAHGSLPWNVPVVIVAHSCVMSWWQAVKGGPAPAKYDEYLRRARAGAKSANLLIAPTRAMLGSLCKAWEIRQPAHARVIYNGTSPELFHIGQKEPFIFTASRLWDEAKNVMFLDRVAPGLPWKIVAAGESTHPCGESLQAKHFTFTGKIGQNEIKEWFSRAAILVSPALYEPFGLAILEAALSGCALVLSDIESLKELWAEAAIFLPPSDPKAWKETLADLAEKPALVREMGEKSRHRALGFTAARMASAYMEAYQTVLCEQFSTRQLKDFAQ